MSLKTKVTVPLGSPDMGPVWPSLRSGLDPGSALARQRGQPVPHRLQLVRWVTDPVDQLAHHAQGLATAERLRRVPRILLVRHVGVVLELTGRLYDVDAPAALAGGELGAPHRRVE